MSKTFKLLPLVAILVVLGGTVSGCSGQTVAEHPLAMAPLDTMPVYAQGGPVAVQQAYQFATANPEILTAIPCYCGCSKQGHLNNYECYVAEADEQSVVTFDAHALGCSICVEITQDVMRLTKQGQSVADIRAYVDANYSRYGPSTMP